MKIRTVTVLGANGAMGRNVAGLFASFGDAKVYVVSRRKEDSEAALEGAAKSVRAGVITRNLIPMDYSSLETCVRESDLVFESVAENLAAKIDVWERVATSLVPGTLACTGTSGLSIDRLASVLPQSCRPFFTGMHFFNPPYAMRLCELCPFADMSEATEAEVKSYLNDVLHRVVVRVGDTPAFLGNKIGFEFINRAMQLAEKYSDRGGIDYVDSILGPFTGRAMAPLNTADFVGLDVHKAIVDNVYSNEPSCPMHDAFSLPAFCTHLVSRGRLGRKTGGGLYKIEQSQGGDKRQLVYDVQKDEFRPKHEYRFPFAEHMVSAIRVGDYKSAAHFLLSDDSEEARIALSAICEYIAFSILSAERVSGCMHAADDVMATGFNWCPPLAMAEFISSQGDLREIMPLGLGERRFADLGLDDYLERIPSSRYDFRRFFRAED